MDVTIATVKARGLMDAHVTTRGWKLKVTDNKSHYGMCSERRRTIYISKGHIELGMWVQVKDTVLHEIAHALVGCNNGHNHVWRAACRQLGCDPAPYGDAPMPQGKWKLVCLECGAVARANVHRRTRRHEGGRHSNCSKHPNQKYGGDLQYQRAIRPEETARHINTMTDGMDN